MNEFIFLTLAEIIEIHQNQLDLYGGKPGLRDMEMLQSALSQPQATFQGDYLHGDLSMKAAAYAFHISQNQPFIDGNKRTGLAAALVFLELNGIEILDQDQKLYDGMMKLATGNLDKEGFAQILKSLINKSD
ncbi:MAG: type II toxin-antitoxin system death-on-curing family toxin [Candidatus Omnitrophota bacterium]